MIESVVSRKRKDAGLGRPAKDKTYYHKDCLNCSSEFESLFKGKVFCSHQCHQDYFFKEHLIKDVEFKMMIDLIAFEKELEIIRRQKVLSGYLLDSELDFFPQLSL